MKDQKKLQARQQESRKKIIDGVVNLIKREGIDAVSVRSVCKEAGIGTGTFYYYFKNKDELLLSFIMEESFDGFKLHTPIEKIADRITELYAILVNKYLSFGRDFMQHFYTPSNTALSAYMCEQNGSFQEGTIMMRCENELMAAVEQGILPLDSDAHQMSVDICAMVKGAIFEYCLTDDRFDIMFCIKRMLSKYIQ